MANSLRKQRIFELDYIRAVSAILIVLYHYTTRYDQSIGHLGNWSVAVPWGSMAVKTFFLLTGYLTVCHYSGSILQFAYKRWCRLWPVFAVCVVITSVFMAFLMPDRLRSIPEILLNLTMVPTYLGARAVDGVYWTLSVEVIFYFWIILCMTQKKHGRLLFCLYGWITLSVAANLCARFGFTPMPVKLVQTVFVTEHTPCFIAGVAICLQYSERSVSTKQVIPLYILCFVGQCACSSIGVVIWSTLWALLIWAVVSEKLHFALAQSNPLHKCLVFFAGISYPLYLLHQFIGFSIIQKLEQWGGLSQLWILVPVAFSILLATAVHYWIELPLGNMLIKLPKKKAKTSQEK